MDEQTLINERERLLSNVVDFFGLDSAVVGVFLGGSIPAGEADAYSDIDLRVVVIAEEHARFIASRLEMPKQWSNFLYNEWLEGAQHCVTHVKPFGKIDIFYLSLANYRPSPWYKLPTRVLYDPKGVIAEVVEKSRDLVFQITEEEVDRSLSKGLASAQEVYRRICRGELFFAQSLLDSIRHHMIQADDWINHRPPQAVTFSKLEKRASESIIQAFRQSYVGLDRRQIEKAFRELFRVYRQQIIELHNQFLLRRSLENDLYAVDLILKEGHEDA